MIQDHRPYRAKRLSLWLERAYADWFVRPHFESLGTHPHLMKPWNISLFGKHIIAGNNFHVVTASDRTVSFSSWTLGDHQGHIQIGDNCLVCPGVRIDSASGVIIGDNCMLAAGAYITDADWHDLYDRTRSIGTTRPVTLAENVWIGDGVVVCKGVTIGRNSVIGAGAVVATDIAENVIAAGNPARVIRSLDPEQELVTRASLFANADQMAIDLDALDRYMLSRNGWLRWFRTMLAPRRGD